MLVFSPSLRKEKDFFFEKKKQKTFMSSGRCWRKVRDSYPKVFWFFFSKKNIFLSALLRAWWLPRILFALALDGLAGWGAALIAR
jgi:hypothetical protein